MSKFGEFPFTRCKKPRRGYANSKTWIPDAHIVQAGHEPFTESNAGVFNAPKGRFVPTPRPLAHAPVRDTRRGRYMKQWAGKVLKSRQDPGWGGSSTFGGMTKKDYARVGWDAVRLHGPGVRSPHGPSSWQGRAWAAGAESARLHAEGRTSAPWAPRFPAAQWGRWNISSDGAVNAAFGRQLNFAPVNPEPGWPGVPGDTSAYGPVYPYVQRNYVGFGKGAAPAGGGGGGAPSGGAPSGGAPSGGGGGGGGMGVGISIDPAAIIDSIVGAVATGKETEARPEIYLRMASNRFAVKLAKIRRDNATLSANNRKIRAIHVERGKIRRQSQAVRQSALRYIKDRSKWLPDPGAKAKWEKAKRGARQPFAEAGARDPIRMRVAMDDDKRVKSVGVSVGKAARYDFLASRAKQIRKESRELYTHDVRTHARRYYQDLLNVESVRPVLLQAANRYPAMASLVQQALQSAQQGNVIARDTLADVFTDPNRFPELHLDATPALRAIVAEAAAGTLPKEFRSQQFQWYMDTWLGGFDVPTIPGWVIGAPLNHPQFLSPFPVEAVVASITTPAVSQMLMQQRQQRIIRDSQK